MKETTIPAIEEAVKERQHAAAEDRVPDEAPRCQYSEWSDRLGDMVRCGLPAHGPKVKHGEWRVIG